MFCRSKIQEAEAGKSRKKPQEVRLGALMMDGINLLDYHHNACCLPGVISFLFYRTRREQTDTNQILS